MAELLFWLMVVLLVYVWGGYLLVLKAIAWFKSNQVDKKRFHPNVTVILTVFNEQESIRKRLDNLISLDYPKDKLEVLVASDGSTDRTHEIVREYEDEGVALSVHEGRGKSITQNEAVRLAGGEIIVFTDASTSFRRDFLKNVVRNFNDPEVGCVTGDIRMVSDGKSISKSQSIYWKYENAVRRFESEIGVLAKASGNSLAIREKLFLPLEGKYGEDCIVPLNTVLQGYRVVYEPDAVIYDEFPSSIGGEFRTRIRMTLRNWSGILSRKQLLNPFKYPLVAFSLLSHKLLRWLSLLFLLVVFVSNLFLLDNIFYQITFYLQTVFYLSAFVGFLLERANVRSLPVFTVPFSFCLANLGMMIGVLRSFMGNEIIKYKVPINE